MLLDDLDDCEEAEVSVTTGGEGDTSSDEL